MSDLCTCRGIERTYCSHRPPDCHDPTRWRITDAMVDCALAEHRRWAYRATTDQHEAMRAALAAAFVEQPAASGAPLDATASSKNRPPMTGPRGAPSAAPLTREEPS